MSEGIHCITNKGKQLKMNKKMMTLTCAKRYAVYIRN